MLPFQWNVACYSRATISILNSQLYDRKIPPNMGSLRRTYNAVSLPKFAASGRLRYSSRVQPHLRFTGAQRKALQSPDPGPRVRSCDFPLGRCAIARLCCARAFGDTIPSSELVEVQRIRRDTNSSYRAVDFETCFGSGSFDLYC